MPKCHDIIFPQNTNAASCAHAGEKLAAGLRLRVFQLLRNFSTQIYELL